VAHFEGSNSVPTSSGMCVYVHILGVKLQSSMWLIARGDLHFSLSASQVSWRPVQDHAFSIASLRPQ